MARRGPSLVALLGLLAVAGFKNRDKLTDLVQKVQAPDADPAVTPGFAGQMSDLLGGSPVGTTISSALTELMSMFKGTPQETDAQSWVASGPNVAVSPDHLAQAIGDDTIADLVAKTGMERGALLQALSRNLPQSVDGMTPEGRLPSDAEARTWI